MRGRIAVKVLSKPFGAVKWATRWQAILACRRRAGVKHRSAQKLVTKIKADLRAQNPKDDDMFMSAAREHFGEKRGSQ